MKYKFLSYDPVYPKLAEVEIERLRPFFSKTTIIEHFGSTAVPGLGGKGVIDLYVVVPKNLMENASEKLQKLGYVRDKNAGDVGERIFHKRKKIINKRDQWCHVHVTHPDNQNRNQCLAFRDYLIIHPEEALLYSEAKKKAANEAQKFTKTSEQKKAYLEAKSEVIKRILEKI